MSWLYRFLLLAVIFGAVHSAFGSGMNASTIPRLRMIDVLYFRDGGTTGFVMTINGREERFCLDGRMSEGNSTPRRHVYLDAIHPSHAGARKVPIGGDEETRILSLLSAYLDSELTAEEQSRLLQGTAQDLDLRHTKLWWTLRVTKTLRSRQHPHSHDMRQAPRE